MISLFLNINSKKYKNYFYVYKNYFYVYKNYFYAYKNNFYI